MYTPARSCDDARLRAWRRVFPEVVGAAVIYLRFQACPRSLRPLWSVLFIIDQSGSNLTRIGQFSYSLTYYRQVPSRFISFCFGGLHFEQIHPFVNFLLKTAIGGRVILFLHPEVVLLDVSPGVIV